MIGAGKLMDGRIDYIGVWCVVTATVFGYRVYWLRGRMIAY